MPETQDAYSDLSLDQAGALGASSPAAAAPLGFFDKVKLGWRQGNAAPDWGYNQANWENRSLSDVQQALTKKGWSKPLVLPGDRATFRSTEENEIVDTFAAVKRLQSADPNFLPDYAGVSDLASFRARIREFRNRELQSVQREAPGGLGAAGFVGELGHGFTDPTSYIPVGGGGEGLSIASRILQTGLREAGANAAVTVALEPLVQMDAAAQGQERGFSDFLTDVVTSGIGGAVIGGTFEGGRGIAEALTPLDRKVARALSDAEVPPEFQGTPFASFDARVARAFADAVPAEKRTPEQQAALNAIDRDTETRAGSPFVGGPEGDDFHFAWVDRAQKAVAGELPDRPLGAPVVTREDVAAGAADLSTVRRPAREVLKAKIHRAETRPGDDYNEVSGAMGPYQFVKSTWVSLFRKRYPGDTRSYEQIAALRRDPHLNEVLMDDLVAENAAALRSQGIAETAGNLYLAHVLGYPEAIRVLKAAPDAALRDLLPAGYFKGNPFKPDDRAGSLVQWAYGKMGDEAGAGQAFATAASGEAIPPLDLPEVDAPAGRYDVEAMLGIAGEEAERPMLRPELFDSPEAHAAAQLGFEASRDAAEGFAPVRTADALFNPYEHFGAVRAYGASGGAVTLDALGEALGVSPQQARRVVQSMMATDRNSPFVLARERGAPKDAPQTRIVRRPSPPGSSGPENLVQFLRRNGGIAASDAGELLHMGAPASLVDVLRHQAREAVRNAKHSKAPPQLREHQIARAERRLNDAERAVKANPRGMALDEAFGAAIEAGYFPQHQSYAESYDQLPDVQDLLDAIDAELRGQPRFAVDDLAAVSDAERAARFGEERPAEPPQKRMDPEILHDELARIGVDPQQLTDAAEALGLSHLDDDVTLDAAERVAMGDEPEQALYDALHEAAQRDADQFAAHAGEPFYATEEGDGINYAEPGEDPLADRQDDAGGGRSPADAGNAGDRAVAAAAVAGDPAVRGEGFDQPVGKAAEAQADSVIHDLEMDAKAAEPDGDAPTYRLDEDGEESDLASILDEIEAAQKAAKEMRGCMTPKGGE